MLFMFKARDRDQKSLEIFRREDMLLIIIEQNTTTQCRPKIMKGVLRYFQKRPLAQPCSHAANHIISKHSVIERYASYTKTLLKNLKLMHSDCREPQMPWEHQS